MAKSKKRESADKGGKSKRKSRTVRQMIDHLCNRCGRCCHEKIIVAPGTVMLTSKPCKYLDTETNLCKMYGKRHQLDVRCLTLAECLREGALPPGCVYLKYFKSVPPKYLWIGA